MMPILENLPSNMSATYSKKDIELFDKYRINYKNFAERIKLYLSHTATNTFNYDDLLDECNGNANILKLIIKNNFTIFTENHRLTDEILYSSLANLVCVWDSYIIITDFYIPDNIIKFKIFLKLINSVGNKEILIGQYDRNLGKIPEIDLEVILEESKSLDFIGSYDLENILLNSKNKVIENQKKGSETIEFNGIEYRRIELIQPTLPLFSKDAMAHIYVKFSTSDNCNNAKKRIIQGVFTNIFCQIGMILMSLLRGEIFTLAKSKMIIFYFQ